MRVSNLTISYGGEPILEGASLSVGQGQFVSLVGPSGSGKSSLLRAVIGLQRPLAGLVETGRSPSEIGILFQDDRNTTKGAGLYHKINGNAGNTFDGALYFPNAALNFIGTSSTGGYMVIVTNTLDIGGTSGLKTDFTTLANVNTLAPASTGGGLVQ